MTESLRKEMEEIEIIWYDYYHDKLFVGTAPNPAHPNFDVLMFELIVNAGFLKCEFIDKL